MPHFEANRTVPYTAAQMFDLVADVEAYPLFVPLCEALTVTGRESDGEGRDVIVADMTVAYKMFSETFTSRVVLDREKGEIVVAYLAGPLSHLENRWHFRDLEEGRSEVAFTIDYEFASRARTRPEDRRVGQACRSRGAPYHHRARAVYGRKPKPPQANMA